MNARTLLALPLILVISPLACATVGPSAPGIGGEGGSSDDGPTSGGAGLGGNPTPGGMGGLGGRGAHNQDECCVLSAVCHVVGGSDDAEVEECHHIGHEENAQECLANFDRCIKLCEGLSDEQEPYSCEE